jgi:excisionase family DNA binding protein
MPKCAKLKWRIPGIFFRPPSGATPAKFVRLQMFKRERSKPLVFIAVGPLIRGGAVMRPETNHLSKLAYSIAEACEASSLGRTTIYSHIAAGRLRVRRVGGRTIIPAENLRAFITGNSNEEASDAASER